MAERADHLEAMPLRPGESRSEWDPVTGGIRWTWRGWPWGPLKVFVLSWILLQSTLNAVAFTYCAVEGWAAGETPIRLSLGAVAWCGISLAFLTLFTRAIQGRGKPAELHASRDGFLYINPTGFRRRAYIPREYIRDVRAEGYFSMLIFREWRLCIELTTPCIPLNFPPKRYTLWTFKGRSYPEAWAKILRESMSIHTAGAAPSPL
jgi:hypothetical protein